MPTTIAIVGRPNVGKSTLFNRMLRKNAAITHDQPGVTRDRIYGETFFDDRRVALIDTGGIEVLDAGEDRIEEGIFAQAREAVEEAHAILLVMDGREGLTPLDERVAEYIRKHNKPVLLAVNKIDGEEREAELLAEFHALGFEMLGVSGEHGHNRNFLREELARLIKDIPDQDEAEGPERGLRIAMLGRPNAGKSSMVNAFIGEKRVIVSPIAGTTRDTVDATVDHKGKRYTFVDTAGVRRKAKVEGSLERFSVVRALTCSKRAQIVILVLDAIVGLTTQDKKLLDFLVKEKTPFLVAVNKIDLIERGKLNEVKQYFKDQMRFCSHAPLVYTSALKGTGLKDILPLAERMWKECQIRVGTGELNRVMRDAITRHQPPQVKYRRPKFYYLTQPETSPPRFLFFVNNPKIIKDSYKRYLENQLRKSFGIATAPIVISFRSSHENKE
ncbi:MAG: ribosome biogenesis GTPase Der [Desulfovibrio sp.]|uniref:ribosome biogenesis GTPase Der n=1 Tax=Desulfovibrio sp. 7SRBS1 TaxID=3378064 RepID=UPI003B3EABE8